MGRHLDSDQFLRHPLEFDFFGVLLAGEARKHMLSLVYS